MAQAPSDPSNVETADPEESSPNMIVYRKVRVWSCSKKSLKWLASKRMLYPVSSQRYISGCLDE